MTARAAPLATIEDVRTVDLPRHRADNGELLVLEGFRQVPFAIVRVFVVRAQSGATRGQHAHIACSQLFVCTSGAMDILCDDGRTATRLRLDESSGALLIPPAIWSEQLYLRDGSVLMVLCDRRYEVDDYIRDYNAFKRFRYEASNRPEAQPGY